MRALSTIRRQFNANNDVTRAAIADAITATLISVTLTVLYFETVNFLGARYPRRTQELFGAIGIIDYVRWENLTVVAMIAGLTFLFSLVAILVASRESRPRPFKRSVTLTTLTLVTVVTGPTALIMLVIQQFNLGIALELLTAFGFAAVPAALRITSPNAFSYQAPSSSAAIWGEISSVTEETP